MTEKIETYLIPLAREKFWAFCLFWDWEFFYDKRPFLYEVAEMYQALYDGDSESVMVSMPPRSGKSYITTLFSAWWIGRNVDETVMRNTCTAFLYNKFSYDCREIVKDHRFRWVFPEVYLQDDKQSLSGWMVRGAKQVSYFGAGVGGTIIGFGASGVAITDDLYKNHASALSETTNDATHQWYQSAHMSRLEGSCRQIDIGTRWTRRDVIGMKLEENRYDATLSIPALIDGKSFCEDVRSTEDYLKMKATTDKFIWLSEYMQEPIEVEGLLFPQSELRVYRSIPKHKLTVCYVDTADEGDDYFCALFCAIVGENVYIKDVLFNQSDLSINEPLMLSRIKSNACGLVHIEMNSAGAYFKRNIADKAKGVRVTGQWNSAHKASRILAQSGRIKYYFLFPEAKTGEMERYMNQLTNYLVTGKSKHDDAPDCTAGVADFIGRQLKIWK